MADVIPFPLVRRRAFIARQASTAANMKREAGDRHVAYQLKVQGEAMRRKGISDDLIRHELRAMENAIRAEIWHAIMSPGGAA